MRVPELPNSDERGTERVADSSCPIFLLRYYSGSIRVG
jgi:hypothetical protein